MLIDGAERSFQVRSPTPRPVLGRGVAAIVLGGLWLLDGLLQLQPSQFTPAFTTSLEMNAMAQPAPIAQLELHFGRMIAPHIAVWNGVFALFQFTLGVLILLSPSRRFGLRASIPWAIGVWILGEGLGGVATGFAMLPTGAPGAALLYAVLACALLASDHVADHWRFVTLSRAAWVTVLASGALLQLTSSVSPALKLRANFNELIDGEPHLAVSVDHQLAVTTAAHAGVVTFALVLVELAMMTAALTPIRSCRGTLPLVLVVLLAFWLFGENFGGVLTGSANDIGSSPLLAVFALATFPRHRRRPAAPLRPIPSEPGSRREFEQAFA